jgi:hypothetical protein
MPKETFLQKNEFFSKNDEISRQNLSYECRKQIFVKNKRKFCRQFRMNKQDEKQVKAYFLGELAEEDAFSVEMRCFDDEGFAEQAFIVEDELIEAYLDGTLSNEECQHFEDNYLVTSARRMRLELVRNLKSGKLADTKQPAPLAAFSESKKPLIASPSNWWDRFWNSQVRLGFAVGLGLLLLVLCAGLFRFFTHPNATVVEQSDGGGSASETNIASSSPSTNFSPSIAETAASPENNNNSVEQPKITNQTVKNSVEKKKETPADLAEKQRSESKTAGQIALGFTLTPGMVRDDSVKPHYVYYSPNKKFTKITLSEVGINRPIARIKLETVENEVVWQKANLKVQKIAGNKYIIMQIPHKVLSERTFIVALYDRDEQIAEYVFQAKRK